DPAAQKISVEIDHFSTFGLLGRVTLPTPSPGSINIPGYTNPAATPDPVQTTTPASIPAAAAPAASPEPTPPAEAVKKEEPPVKPIYWVVMVLVIMVAVAAFTVFKISSNRNKIDEGKM
ncbi:MAG: hypothetical protein PHU23_18075, partial [Dehalococcoidales bacterium]|nr:hypothetical protein [Dehalococcoidales bacterium]